MGIDRLIDIERCSQRQTDEEMERNTDWERKSGKEI
jgi:hypothetical protein